MKPRLIKDISTYSIFLITILLLISTGKWEIKWWYFFPIFLIIKFIVSIVYTGIWGFTINDLIKYDENNETQKYILNFQYRIVNHYSLNVEISKSVNIKEFEFIRMIHNQISMKMIINTIKYGQETKIDVNFGGNRLTLTFYPIYKN